jgi:hypothetical protein
MRRTDLLQRTRIAALVVPVGLAGCAVMNIDVDVYKGPLANHKDVQTEQLAAMVVGAHPLLTRLFVIMAGPQKEPAQNEKQYTTRFPGVDANPPDAAANSARDACTYKPDTVSMIMCRAERAGMLTRSTNYVIGRASRPTIVSTSQDDIRKREELQKAQLLADIIAVLRLYENRALTAAEFNDQVEGTPEKDKVAFALQQLLRQMSPPPPPRKLEQLSREVAKLIEPGKLRRELERNPQLKPLQTVLRREAKDYAKDDDFRRALERVLNDYPIDASKDLLIAVRSDVMPAIAKEDANDAIEFARKGAEDSFSRGRLDVGIFDQVEAYLNANYASAMLGCSPHASPGRQADCALARELRKDDPRAGMIEIKRDRLIKALNGFSQKVLSLANNVILFTEQKRLDQEAGLAERDKAEIEHENLLKNYIRVLQTVGNSLLALADAMVQEDSHSVRMREGHKAEAAAMQTARAITPGSTYEQIIAVLESRVRSLESAKAGGGKEGESLEAQLTQVRAKLEALPRTGPAVDFSDDMLRYAHAWVSLGADPKELNLPARPDLARSAAARAAVEAIVKKAASAEQTYSALAEVLEQGRQAAAIRADAATVTRLRNALVVLKSDAFRNAVTQDPVPASAKAQVDRISSQIRKLYADGSEAFLSAASQRDKLEQEAARLEGDLRAAARTRPAASAAALQETIDAVYELRTRREDFLPVLEKRNGAPVAAVIEHMERVANKPSAPRDAKRVPPAAANVFVAMAGGTPTSDEHLRKQNAIKALAGVQLPAQIDASGLRPNPNTKDVFDGLVAVLRHKHIAAVETYGPGSEQVAKSSATLVEAYRQRAGMVYLRPAVSYLRTSFAATTLQNNLLAWSNLLEDHGYKSSMPLVPTAVNEGKQYVPTEIDKQFWQNVNQVRLSGVGSVNYAIAKDDIGNWYVKAYAADAKSIIDSAKNLALFNLGAKTGTDLLARANPGAEGGAQPSSYARVFERFEAKYQAATKKDAESLGAAMESLAETLRQAWRSEPQTAAQVEVLDAKLKAPAAELKDAREALTKASAADADAKKQPLALVNGLRALLRFERAVAANVRGSVTSDARQELKAAQDLVRAKQAEVSAADAELVRAERREADARSTVTGQGANVTEEATAGLREATQALSAARRNRDQKAEELQPLVQAQAAKQADLETKTRAEATASARASELARERIATLLAARQRTVGEFENAVAAIGDARSEAPAVR